MPLFHPLKQGSIDTAVLACTHFPLIKEVLQQCLPNITYWVDSGGHRIQNSILYRTTRLVINQTVMPQHHAFYTQAPQNHDQFKRILARFSMTQDTLIDV